MATSRTAGAASTDAGRMSAAERRALILESARGLFGQRGYYGTTTDQVARAAGISQPYVVRMFGTKENLFLEVVAGTLETLLDAFRATLAAHRERGGQPEELGRALGNAFVDLITTRGLHTVLLQSFVSGADAAIGAQARAGFLEIYRFLRDEAGFGPDEVNTFLSSGMLFSVLLGIELPALYGRDPGATELMEATFGAKCQAVLAAMDRAPE